MELGGKVALVTGSGKRVGRAIALALARAGADVVVHYNRSAAEAEAVAGEIRQMGLRATTHQADLADPGQIESMFAAAEAFGRLDVLVNSAAVFERTPIESLTGEQWDDQERVLAQVPLRRPGRPEDVAAAVVFLARHDYMTGQNLRVDGGWHMG